MTDLNTNKSPIQQTQQKFSWTVLAIAFGVVLAMSGEAATHPIQWP